MLHIKTLHFCKFLKEVVRGTSPKSSPYQKQKKEKMQGRERLWRSPIGDDGRRISPNSHYQNIEKKNAREGKGLQGSPIGDDGPFNKCIDRLSAMTERGYPLTPIIKTWRKKNARERKGLQGSPIGDDGPFNKCTDRLSAMTEGGYRPNPPYQNMEKNAREGERVVRIAYRGWRCK